MPIVRLLVEHGACVDRLEGEPGRTTLISAAAQGHRACVRHLLDEEADTDLTF